MTEAEWQSSPTSELLLQTLELCREKWSSEAANATFLIEPRSALRADLGRKHLLLAYAILRQYWQSLNDEVRFAITRLEAFEDEPGKILEEPLEDFGHLSDLFLGPIYRGDLESETSMAMWLVAGWWPDVKAHWPSKELPKAWQKVIRDIFGNPFRPVALNPSWLTPTVLALANGIYSEKAFDRMPILADALQDAGCDNEDVLNHCRQPGEHVRGCWVVDLLLGKE